MISFSSRDAHCFCTIQIYERNRNSSSLFHDLRYFFGDKLNKRIWKIFIRFSVTLQELDLNCNPRIWEHDVVASPQINKGFKPFDFDISSRLLAYTCS